MLFNILSIRSGSWSRVRSLFLKNNPQCCACGTKRKLQVHHIQPVHLCPEKELDTTNMITLCKSCHFIFGHLMDWSSWNINVVTDAKVYLNKVSQRPYKDK